VSGLFSFSVDHICTTWPKKYFIKNIHDNVLKLQSRGSKLQLSYHCVVRAPPSSPTINNKTIKHLYQELIIEWAILRPN